MQKRRFFAVSRLALAITLIFSFLLTMVSLQTPALADDGGGGPCPGDKGSGGVIDDSLSQVISPPADGQNVLSSVMMLLFEAIF